MILSRLRHENQFITIMQNMSSGNHCILYKRPHPDFFRKMFTLCFCFNQNVSPLISPWFRHFLFPVPPSFSCQWSVLGPRCSRRHCVRPGQGGPLSPRPHRTPGTPGWSATRHVTPPPSCHFLSTGPAASLAAPWLPGTLSHAPAPRASSPAAPPSTDNFLP